MPECQDYVPFHLVNGKECFRTCPDAYPVSFESSKECLAKCPLYNPVSCSYSSNITNVLTAENCTFLYCVDMCPAGRENTNGVCTDIIKAKSKVPMIVGITLGVFFGITAVVVVILLLFTKRKNRLRNKRESMVIKIGQKGAKWG